MKPNASQKRLDDLRAERKAKLDRMDAMLAAAAAREQKFFNDAETAEFDGLDAQAQQLKAHLDRCEKAIALGQDLDRVQEPARRAPINHDRHEDADRNGEISGLGHLLSIVAFAPNDERIQNFRRRDLPQAMTSTTGPGGGFAIPPEYEQTLKELQQAEAFFRPRVTPVPVDPERPDADIYMPSLDQGTASQNMFGGVVVEYAGETATPAPSDLKVRQVRLKPNTYKANLQVPNILLMNWRGANALLERQFMNAEKSLEETKFYNGDGVGKPTGILKLAAALTVNRAISAAVAFADIVAMIDKSRLGLGLVWLASDDLRGELMKLEDNAGNLIFVPSARDGEPDRLFGRALHFSERSVNKGTKGDLCLVDLSYYLATEGYPRIISASAHEKHSQDITTVKLLSAHDGNSWLAAPITVEGGRQRSPFVLLDVPA